MHKFKELNVWQKAVDLSVDIYQITKKFSSDERFDLTSQMNRCSVSMPSNIAEGQVEIQTESSFISLELLRAHRLSWKLN